MISDVLFLAYFALPGMLANMAPVFAAKGNWLEVLDKPIDGGLYFRGKRLLGDNKTVRGFAVGLIFASLVIIIQNILYSQFQPVRDFSVINYSTINPLIFAIAMTFGALGGDALKSFFKRQLGRKPGQSWIPFDQADSVVGIFIVALFYLDFPVSTWIVGLIVGTLSHPLSTTIAWVLKLKEKPL